MIYINTATSEYPISFTRLKERHKNVSFSKAPDSFMDYARVHDGDVPTHTDTQYVEEGAPTVSEGVYSRNWVVHDFTDEQIAQRQQNKDAAAANSIRRTRDTLLSDTDWIVIKAQETGTSVPTDMATYRQALRDITDHASFPHLSEDDWPVKP